MCASRSALKVPSIFSELGYKTVTELGRAAMDWIEIHKFNLFMQATAFIEISCGGAETALNVDQAVIFKIGPPELKPDGTPATSFAIKSLGLVYRDSAAPHWFPSAVAHRAARTQKLLALCPDRDLLGLAPISFCIQDAHVNLYMDMPLYRRRSAAGAMDDDTALELKRLIYVCTTAMNTGTVLRIPVDASQKLPDLGRLVRQGRSWEWTPYAPGSSIPASLGKLRGFAAYHRSWPYTSLLTTASRQG